MNIIDQRLLDYAPASKSALARVRALVHDVASQTPKCGQVVEALKWNQISFLTQKPKSGTTIRIDQNGSRSISLYVHCTTNLVDQVRELYGDTFDLVGTREIVLPNHLEPVEAELRHVIALALTYHQNKRAKL
ncbi:DUF1801 domain-containing protein [Maritalea sp.]|uniref:DUF1801 domain-containing protein n=1 Tax=Maritalea sp. TaxID=2003361 RepID=UPI003EF988F9